MLHELLGGVAHVGEAPQVGLHRGEEIRFDEPGAEDVDAHAVAGRCGSGLFKDGHTHTHAQTHTRTRNDALHAQRQNESKGVPVM